MSAKTAITVKEPRLQKTIKESNLQRKINRGKVMIVAQNNQRSQRSIPVKPCSAATSMRNWNKNTNKKANRGKNQNWKTTKMLTEKTWVMLCCS